jgi:hypothetical protein
MTDNTAAEGYQQSARPHPDLKLLDRLVGTWRVSGGAEGTIRYEWMEGGFFLVQHVALNNTKGIEIIGHWKPFGEGPSEEIRSRYYDYHTGDTLDYVYELDGETLTIWGGEKGSPAYYRGQFSADGNSLKGAWVYPGGGYESNSTRVES